MPFAPKIENSRSLYAPDRRPHTNKHSSIALQNKEAKKRLNENIRSDNIS
jgi:hypothetical protein